MAVFRIKNYLESNQLCLSFMSAYPTLRNTETPLITVINYMNLALDKGEELILIILHLSASFDSNDHSSLLTMLYQVFGLGINFK